ncbi:hypothetical protein ACUY3R_06425 [Corynebacterium sp. 23_3061]
MMEVNATTLLVKGLIPRAVVIRQRERPMLNLRGVIRRKKISKPANGSQSKRGVKYGIPTGACPPSQMPNGVILSNGTTLPMVGALVTGITGAVPAGIMVVASSGMEVPQAGWNGQPGQGQGQGQWPGQYGGGQQYGGQYGSQYGGQYGAAQSGANQWNNAHDGAQYGQGQYTQQPQYNQNAQYGQGRSGGSSVAGSQGDPGQSGSSIWKVLLPIILILVVVAALIGALIWKPWEKNSNDAVAPGDESSAIPQEPRSESTVETTTEPEDTETTTEDTTTERTTTTTTTSRNDTGADIPGLGRQGFTDNSAATCNADDEWVYAGINEDGDKVVICQVGDTDGFYYRGWYHGGALERDVTSRGSGGRTYSMKSGGTVINIDGSTLNVVQNGKTVSSTVFDGVATREPDWG